MEPYGAPLRPGIYTLPSLNAVLCKHFLGRIKDFLRKVKTLGSSQGPYKALKGSLRPLRGLYGPYNALKGALKGHIRPLRGP